MSVTSDEIKFYTSANGLGGDITNTQINTGSLHNVFDIVDKNGSRDGETNYRCIYLRNTNPTHTMLNTKVFLSSSEHIAIGSAVALAGETELPIASEDIEPPLITFVTGIGINYALDIGDIPPNSFIAIWLRRIIPSATESSELKTATLVVECETL